MLQEGNLTAFVTTRSCTFCYRTVVYSGGCDRVWSDAGVVKDCMIAKALCAGSARDLATAEWTLSRFRASGIAAEVPTAAPLPLHLTDMCTTRVPLLPDVPLLLDWLFHCCLTVPNTLSLSSTLS